MLLLASFLLKKKKLELVTIKHLCLLDFFFLPFPPSCIAVLFFFLFCLSVGACRID